MRLIFFLSVGLFVLSVISYDASERIDFVTRKEAIGVSDTRVLGEGAIAGPDLRKLFKIFLNDHGLVRAATLQSYKAPAWPGDLDVLDWKTDMEVADRNYSRFSFSGWLSSAYSIDLEKDGQEELVVEVITGKTVGTIVYKFVGGVLSRIPVSTEVPGTWGFYGISSRESPEFKDIDDDGKLEMLAYYRFFPPEKRRRVEVYKFTGSVFQKIKEYEEKMPEVYL
ncbi:MAG: hypothetical protein M1352_01185 [Patescibacteria group bacterium]|nr:hypothetical protein [Patescibacteria group bacterium]